MSQRRQSGGHAVLLLVRSVTLRPCLSTGLPFLADYYIFARIIIHAFTTKVITLQG